MTERFIEVNGRHPSGNDWHRVSFMISEVKYYYEITHTKRVALGWHGIEWEIDMSYDEFKSIIEKPVDTP